MENRCEKYGKASTSYAKVERQYERCLASFVIGVILQENCMQLFVS